MNDIKFYKFFTEGERTIWFIGVIFIFYLIFPLIYKLIVSKSGATKAFVLILVIYAADYGIWQLWPSIYNNIEIGVMRLPCFILGALCAYLIKKDIQIKNIISVLITIGLVFKLIDVFVDMPQYYSRIIATFYAISLVLIVCYLLEKFQWKQFNKIMGIVGAYSLELYMIHVCTRKLVKSIGIYTCKLDVYIGIIVVSIILSLTLHKIVEKINM